MSIKLTGATSGSIEIDVPDAVSGGDISLTLPNGVGSAGQVLKNSSTAGTLEFANGGKILQVEQTVNTSRASITATSTYTTIPNFTVSITPSSSSSKILVLVQLSASSAGNYAGANLRLARTIGATTDNTIYYGDAAGSRYRATIAFTPPQFYVDATYGPGVATINYLDSPSTTSAVTYGLQFQDDSGSADILYLNAATAYSTDSADHGTLASSIIAMEVAS